jgi:RimJ/RimL family protein N-acetyltransferase
MPLEELIIRPARPEDASQIIAITQVLAQEEGCYVSYTLEEASIDVAKEQARIQRLTDLFIVAEMDRKVIGDLSLANDSWTLTGHVAYLGMEIQKGYRNQGIGTRMMQQALDWAKRQRIKRVELEVFAENTPAIHLYQKFGFEIEGRKRHAVYKWDRYLDMLVMGLLLPDCQ